jgi:peptide chain release factor 1
MSKSLIPKLQAIKQRYNEVADLIIQPDVITDQKRYGQLNKEYSDLGKIVKVFDEYMQALNTIEESDEIIADGSDKDFVELAKIEKNEALEKIPGLEEELKVLLIPKDPADDKNIILEMRAELVVTKLRFLWKICTECILCISKPKVGDTKSPILLKRLKVIKNW